MTSSVSSKLRLLLDSAPFSNVDPELLAQHEDAIAAWQLDIGHELASENIPLSHVVLVVEGTLRVVVEMPWATLSHCGASILEIGGVFGVHCRESQPLHAVPPKQPSFYLFQLNSFRLVLQFIEVIEVA